jgi:thioredoxin reductase
MRSQNVDVVVVGGGPAGLSAAGLEGARMPGLYVAGDASEDVQLAIVAAAEGAKRHRAARTPSAG